jgi:large subunit ribosomal protein L28
MAKACQICGKRIAVGHNISKAHNLTKRRFEPNLHKITAVIDGKARKVRACTRCIRSGKIIKVVRTRKVLAAVAPQ